MFFNWFDAHEAVQCGHFLAQFFAERVSVEAGKGGKKSLPKKQLEAVGKMFAQAERFGNEHKLNIYKKAKLGNAFKWRLKELGYTDALIDELTKELLLHL
ncbi:MAG: hypothetical protein WC091_09145 [Sulfuricellaceae bacterium]